MKAYYKKKHGCLFWIVVIILVGAILVAILGGMM